MRLLMAWPVALALLLTGCSSPEVVVEPSAGAPDATRSAAPTAGPPAVITHDEISPMLRDYDARNNAAIALADTQLDPSGWAAADSGAVLRIDEFETAYARAAGAVTSPHTLTTTPQQLYAPAFDGYLRWFMAAVTMTPGGEAEADQGQRLLVFEQQTAQDAWRMDTAMDLPGAAPESRDAGSTASAAQVAAARRALEGIQAYLGTGVPTTIQPDQSLNEFQSAPYDQTKPGLVGEPQTITPFRGQDGSDDSVRVVRVEGGALAILTFEYHRRFTVEKRGDAIWLDDPVLAKTLHQEGKRVSVVASGVLFVAVLLPDGGPPQVLTSDSYKTL
ncbi:hypothetical protein [Cellulomonas sp. URHD0024]|uniref:hypothetical protein n=1 Tax=Cellulomonas sp. URHD0024 TaxID=1302620 RepID=UPI0004150B84|nr:hypothetical protein [Cellulomonas sp. URHD0024]